MNAYKPASLALIFSAVLTQAATAATVEEQREAQGSYIYSADVLDSSLRSDTLELHGNVRVVQGPMSIEANQATASAFRSENSRWRFEDSVRVRTERAELASESASAAFLNGELVDARVEGTPATFEQRGGSLERAVSGRADIIEYDVASEVITLRGDVWFSYGKDEFRGDTVVYDIPEERVRVNPGGTSPGRVKGIIRPRSNGAEQTPTPPENDPAAPNEGTASGASSAESDA